MVFAYPKGELDPPHVRAVGWADLAGVDMYIAAIGEITMSLAVATGACIGPP